MSPTPANPDRPHATCLHGWPEGCEYHLPDDPIKWCHVCSIWVLLIETRRQRDRSQELVEEVRAKYAALEKRCHALVIERDLALAPRRGDQQ